MADEDVFLEVSCSTMAIIIVGPEPVTVFRWLDTASDLVDDDVHDGCAYRQ